MDRGGRRSGFDRRQLSIPPGSDDQRGAIQDRRSGIDRRRKWSFDPNDPQERRSLIQINNGI